MSHETEKSIYAGRKNFVFHMTVDSIHIRISYIPFFQRRSTTGTEHCRHKNWSYLLKSERQKQISDLSDDIKLKDGMRLQNLLKNGP